MRKIRAVQKSGKRSGGVWKKGVLLAGAVAAFTFGGTGGVNAAELTDETAEVYEEGSAETEGQIPFPDTYEEPGTAASGTGETRGEGTAENPEGADDPAQEEEAASDEAEVASNEAEVTSDEAEAASDEAEESSDEAEASSDRAEATSAETEISSEKAEATSAETEAASDEETGEEREFPVLAAAEEIKNGWYQEDGYWYYADPEGNTIKDQVIVIDGKMYYLDEEGRMAADTVITLEDELYYANERGVIRTTGGWLSCQGDWYYAEIDGSLYRNRLVQKKGISWYMGSDGRMVTDQDIQPVMDGILYYFRAGEDGILTPVSGWLLYEDCWYYIGEDGKMAADSFVSNGDKLYFVKDNGQMAAGEIISADDKLYYVNASGAVKTTGGWFNFQGDRYYAEIDGSLYHNRLVQKKGISWYMGPDGRMVTDQEVQPVMEGQLYHFHAGEDGVLTPVSGWLLYEGCWYYIGEDGKMAADSFVSTEDKLFYVKDNGQMAAGEIISADDKLYYVNSAGVVKTTGGWITCQDEWYYAEIDGSLYQNRLVQKKGISRYMGQDGRMVMDQDVQLVIEGIVYHFHAAEDGILSPVSGWLLHEGCWYYIGEDGKMAEDTLVSTEGKLYYVKDNGQMAAEEIISIDDRLYYVNASGAVKTTGGWFSCGGDWYYAEIDGSLYRDRLVQKKGISWYMGSDGRMITDQTVVIRKDGVLHRFHAGSDGILAPASGWQKENGFWYYIGADGAAVSGCEVTDEGKTYRFDAEGRMLKAVVLTGNDGALHYVGKDGAYYTGTGWIKCGRGWYFAGEGGRLLQNELLQWEGNSYFLKDNGRMLVKGRVSLGEMIPYRAGADGVLSQIRGEWFRYEDYWYYIASDGTIYRNRMAELRGVTYCFDTEGHMLRDTFFTVDGEIRYAAKNGAVRMQRGWIQSGEKWYFANEDGTLCRSTTMTINGLICHFNSRGEWQDMEQYYTGIIEDTSYTEIDGRRYHVDADGNIDSWFGIDVSAWNGVIDWEKVAADGIDFAFIRAGGRFAASGEIYDDSKLVENVQGATAAGIPVGVYFFSQAITEEEAVEEALYTINRLKGLNIELPVIIDTEYKSGARHNNLTIQERTDVVRAFCETVENNGYRAMYYAGMRWCEDGVDPTQLSEYMHWCAQWWIRNQCDDMGVPYQIWQYTDSGSVDGIRGDVDFNIWYRQ